MAMDGNINNKGEDMMATRKQDKKDEVNVYEKIERIVLEKVIALEVENAQLKNELISARAKLDIYERIATVSNSKVTLGFGPPIQREEDQS